MSLQSKGHNDPGQLDRRVTLRFPYVTADAVGGPQKTWINAATVWASRANLSGARLYAAEVKNAIELIVFRIRHRLDVTHFWQLVHGDDVFEIIPPITELGRRQFLELMCRGVNHATVTALDVLQLEGPAVSNFFALEDGSPLELEAAA